MQYSPKPMLGYAASGHFNMASASWPPSAACAAETFDCDEEVGELRSAQYQPSWDPFASFTRMVHSSSGFVSPGYCSFTSIAPLGGEPWRRLTVIQSFYCGE